MKSKIAVIGSGLAAAIGAALRDAGLETVEEMPIRKISVDPDVSPYVSLEPSNEPWRDKKRKPWRKRR